MNGLSGNDTITGVGFEAYDVFKLSNETDFLFTKVFIFFKHQCHPLQNGSLGQLHTNGDIVPTYGSSAGSLQLVWSSASLGFVICIVLYLRSDHCCPMHSDLFRSIVLPRI